MLLRFIAILLLLPSFTPLGAAPKIEDIYQQNCAACHGVKFEGGVGGKLTDGIWKYGGSDEEIFRSIAKGNLDMGMTPWDGILDEREIRAMVIYLRELEKQEAYRTANLPRPDGDRAIRTQRATFRLEPVVDGLSTPWGLAFLPDGRMLVTECDGRLRIVSGVGKLSPEPVRGLPSVVRHGQGGLLDVAVHPSYRKNGWIYLALSDGEKTGDNAKTLTAIQRGRIKDGKWSDAEWIYRGSRDYYGSAGVHFGSRIVFRDGYVFFVVGERGGMMAAQDVTRPEGKIFRLFDDGRVPPDNPFIDTPGAEPGIWSYGHRNPQGLAFDAKGVLYATEHGPRGGDEFNRIKRGANYGWPVITHGMNYNGTPITGATHKEGMEQPVIHWTPSIAACGLAVYQGGKFPEWQGDFFAGGLASEEIRRLRVRDGEVVEQELILKGAGRVRDIKAGPDGLLYIAFNQPDRIMRIVPAD